jgi:hypothetical protein
MIFLIPIDCFPEKMDSVSASIGRIFANEISLVRKNMVMVINSTSSVNISGDTLTLEADGSVYDEFAPFVIKNEGFKRIIKRNAIVNDMNAEVADLNSKFVKFNIRLHCYMDSVFYLPLLIESQFSTDNVVGLKELYKGRRLVCMISKSKAVYSSVVQKTNKNGIGNTQTEKIADNNNQIFFPKIESKEFSQNTINNEQIFSSSFTNIQKEAELPREKIEMFPVSDVSLDPKDSLRIYSEFFQKQEYYYDALRELNK